MSRDVQLTRKNMERLRQNAESAFETWEQSWTGLKAAVEAKQGKTFCDAGCNACCYTMIPCSVSEGASVLHFLEMQFSPDIREYFRMRVESDASSLGRLRREGSLRSEEHFFRDGGLECPFLYSGLCAIYPVRPLKCRVLNSSRRVGDCRVCPESMVGTDVRKCWTEIAAGLKKKETAILPPIPASSDPPLLLPEVLSFLWEHGAPFEPWNIPSSIWKSRLESRRSNFDETWQDDRSDFMTMLRPLSLPAEGDYPPDFTLVKQRFETHEVYDQRIQGETLPDFLTLYKRDRDTVFDWESKSFKGEARSGSALPYTVWMSDGPQERLMMWEAAKRSRGRILCGGLGLGIFPQLALSLPRVQAIDVVEMDEKIIPIIQKAWERHPWPGSSTCRILHASIEDYLRNSPEKYDTVYIDTWDSIYHEYLPHLNELKTLAKRVLNPDGEILLWAYDQMVRHFLNSVRLVIERREKFINMSPGQNENLLNQYPLLHRVVTWLQSHPRCSDEALLAEGYRAATRERRLMGILRLSGQPGAKDLLYKKYFSSPAT